MAELTIVTYPGEDGYIVAECLEISGCLSQGKTEVEAIQNIQDAIRECLSVMLEDLVKQHHPPKSHAGRKDQRTVRVQPPEVELIRT
jgi:predicted RNase H-like HicB family nuclease